MTFYETVIIEAMRRGEDPVEAVKTAIKAVEAVA